jgi:hypothetical protein
MKKIFLSENKIINNKKLLAETNNELKLPPFIYKRVVKHNTSLGDNMAFPPEDEYSFDYKILKQRFIEVTEKIKEIEDINPSDEESLITYLGSLIKECRDIERPIRENLIKICENSVIKLLAIPDETINLNCSLVDRIEPQNSLRVMPESSDNRDFDFEDLTEYESVNKVILKRRLINALIQGASYEYSHSYELYLHELFKLNKKLPELYDKITIINDYLLFTKEEDITDKNPMQGAYVEVILGHNGEKSEINVQGLLFPYLLAETIRGFFELFASHGLPNDNKKAMYIIKQADFLLAEPWDLRMGVGLWRMLSSEIKDTRLLPYFFAEICELSVDDFNHTLKEIFASTKLGKKILYDLVDTIEHNVEFQDLTNTIKQKNSEYALISDGYFSADELNDYVIEEDDNNTNNITIEMLKEVKAEDIRFEVGEVEDFIGVKIGKNIPQYQLYPVINNIELPINLVNFKAEERIVNEESIYQIHLFINEKIQHIGLGFKLCYAFILNYGVAYTGFGREMNHNEVPKIWNKLASLPNIITSKVYGKNNQLIGIKAELK